MTAGTTASHESPDDLWVFGYGSLMWRPGFAHRERRSALMRGWRRRLCVLSHYHRGTPERPGLVLGLDRGGACRGVAYRVDAARADATVAYLREREQVTSVYVEMHAPARLDDGRVVRALAYRVDRAHRQYLAAAAREELLAIVRRGVGHSGENPAYILSTHAHLAEMGVADPDLAWLAARLARCGADTGGRPAPTGRPRQIA